MRPSSIVFVLPLLLAASGAIGAELTRAEVEAMLAAAPKRANDEGKHCSLKRATQLRHPVDTVAALNQVWFFNRLAHRAQIADEQGNRCTCDGACQRDPRSVRQPQSAGR